MDRFDNHARSLTGPATGGADAAPGAGDLPQVSRALWVGGAGALALTLADGAQVVLREVPAGTLVPVRARAVRAGTTATGIVALW